MNAVNGNRLSQIIGHIVIGKSQFAAGIIGSETAAAGSGGHRRTGRYAVSLDDCGIIVNRAQRISKRCTVKVIIGVGGQFVFQSRHNLFGRRGAADVNIIAVAVVGKLIFGTVDNNAFADIIVGVVAGKGQLAAGVVGDGGSFSAVAGNAAETGQRAFEVVNRFLNCFHRGVHRFDFDFGNFVVFHKRAGNAERRFQRNDAGGTHAVAGIVLSLEAGNGLKAVKIDQIFVGNRCVGHIQISCISRYAHFSVLLVNHIQKHV